MIINPNRNKTTIPPPNTPMVISPSFVSNQCLVGSGVELGNGVGVGLRVVVGGSVSLGVVDVGILVLLEVRIVADNINSLNFC